MPTTTIDDIPFDLWYQIASCLDPQDYINLSFVNRQLYSLLKSDLTARKTVQLCISHTREGKLAAKGKITYIEALRRVYDVREAVATAQPYSACLVAYGESFLFNQGVLCYLDEGEIRTLDVHGAAREEQVVNVGAVLLGAWRVPPDFNQGVQFSLLNYSHGIVAGLCEIAGLQPWLIVLDIREKSTSENRRLLFLKQLESSRRIFVRHNDLVLFYGTHSRFAEHGHHEWVIHGWDLVERRPLAERPVQLENFVGSEIGSSICFELHDNHFYAVSNANRFEDEEIDWTSYYICIRFPVQTPHNVEWRALWRRQHREGPIHDMWTNISLQSDDATNQPLIIESRREWSGAGSKNYRTYYMQPLSCCKTDFSKQDGLFQGKDSQTGREPHSSDESYSPGFPKYLSVRLLPDDPLTSALDGRSKPNYQPPKIRLRRNYHPEYDENELSSSMARDFIFAKTKYRTYNHSASAFIDLVNDNSESKQQIDRLRLRVGSRKRRNPIGEDGLLHPPELDNQKEPIPNSDERFESRGIKLWPPLNSHPELLSLLCPPERCGDVDATSDERSMVYSTAPATSGGKRPIILISFDPTIHLGNVRRCPVQVVVEESYLPVEIDRGDTRLGKGKRKASTEIESKKLAPGPMKPPERLPIPCFRTEEAMYLHINRSYWLR
ncbi:F-box domain-containing protein [Histoplasma capsulatum G186AR]|uniref:F-box domain-containing protein n=2 Tax=Ajellomyces capsulatus TaxID=5037 RepID=C0NQJ3_AJECG|nr:F-box domain-containing protein [Histoplasma capsulatum G186AR]EEH06465.1 F-box domain-containing protein [Histoplasma capsulatum G186AR]KAG5293073.1 F-box domain-containing protein [Histoplasma capsulatum]QSS74525.1 F-box domain-containing protein [Histoplasma capsulatum G186AR]